MRSGVTSHMVIAIVGATGLVGRTMCAVLHERNVQFSSLRLLASSRSEGEVIAVGGIPYTVESLQSDSFQGVDVALFSAGGSISKTYAPIAAAAGCIVIDNSSAWRMHGNVPLVVPEVNPLDVEQHHSIIANPNCSTIQLVVALHPLHRLFNIKRVVVSTYQSVSGAGQKGVRQLETEIGGGTATDRISTHNLAYNTVFHGADPASPADAPVTEEEAKIVRETRRILHLPELPMAVTCVRIPVTGGHAESVSIEFNSELPPVEEIRALLDSAPGINIVDNLAADVYPTPLSAQNTDAVHIGRIRRDTSVPHGLQMWVVADNLRKGAATNAVQILELLQKLQTVRSDNAE